jgi:predicted 3-demethylubiquinone-9 3-methyltransferase (glyoxalase superfamily)
LQPHKRHIRAHAVPVIKRQTEYTQVWEYLENKPQQKRGQYIYQEFQVSQILFFPVERSPYNAAFRSAVSHIFLTFQGAPFWRTFSVFLIPQALQRHNQLIQH